MVCQPHATDTRFQITPGRNMVRKFSDFHHQSGQCPTNTWSAMHTRATLFTQRARHMLQRNATQQPCAVLPPLQDVFTNSHRLVVLAPTGDVVLKETWLKALRPDGHFQGGQGLLCSGPQPATCERSCPLWEAQAGGPCFGWLLCLADCPGLGQLSLYVPLGRSA